MLRLEDIVLTSTDTLDLNNQDLEDCDAIAIAEAIWERTTPIVVLNVGSNVPVPENGKVHSTFIQGSHFLYHAESSAEALV